MVADPVGRAIEGVVCDRAIAGMRVRIMQDCGSSSVGTSFSDRLFTPSYATYRARARARVCVCVCVCLIASRLGTSKKRGRLGST